MSVGTSRYLAVSGVEQFVGRITVLYTAPLKQLSLRIYTNMKPN